MATIAADVQAERAELEREIGGRTVLSVFLDTVRAHPDEPALHWRTHEGWKSLSWSEYRDRVRQVAYGLRAGGFKPGGFAVIMARNRPEHVIADLGVLFARGVPVSLYNTSAPEQIAYIAGHCEATVAFVEDDFGPRFDAVRDQLPALRRIVSVDRDWDALLQQGREAAAGDSGWFEAALDEVGPDDLATLIYTSGTTGPPKGVMDAHRNVLWMIASTNHTGIPGRSEDRHLSYLPLAHAFERSVGHWNQLWCGYQTFFCPDPLKLFEYSAEVHPTLLIGSPRVWEKLQAGMLAAIAADAADERRTAVQHAIEIGRQLTRCRERGEEPPHEIAAAAERAAPVWYAIRAKVGLDECRIGVTGAAPISPDVIEFFRAIDLPLVEGWGMSECTVGGTVNELGKERIGTVGRRDFGVELRLAEDGELLLRGGNIMKGYYKDPEQTAETIDSEGWLHTGDIARIDEDGYVTIVDRKKELIITSGGKNISPANIENLLKQHPLVGQAAAIGDRRSYVTALIVLDPDVAPAWARSHGIEFGSVADLAADERVLAEVRKAVDAANEHLSRAEQVKRFKVLPEEWTVESEVLTPTLKLKRRVINEKYENEIASLYSSGGL
jgi:long-chain acyl-CoA synthetase